MFEDLNASKLTNTHCHDISIKIIETIDSIGTIMKLLSI